MEDAITLVILNEKDCFTVCYLLTSSIPGFCDRISDFFHDNYSYLPDTGNMQITQHVINCLRISFSRENLAEFNKLWEVPYSGEELLALDFSLDVIENHKCPSKATHIVYADIYQNVINQ